MSEIDADAILPNDRVQQSVAAGEITQLTRGASNRYASEGDTFEIDGEGSESLDAYKQRMKRVHPEGFTWDDTEEVLTYRFEQVE